MVCPSLAAAQLVHLVKDIRPGLDIYPAGEPLELARVGSHVYFSALDGRGRELWRTDGTDAGTSCVEDLIPGPQSSDPTQLTDVEGRAFFTIADGNELWVSDGTEAGTARVRAGFVDIHSLTSAGGQLFRSIGWSPPIRTAAFEPD
jgi:ELWxxDGT repeat protein